jgi:hypothetical protein
MRGRRELAALINRLDNWWVAVRQNGTITTAEPYLLTP